MKYVLRVLLVALFLSFWVFSSWVFLLAPCSVVKDYWWVSHVPGRCLATPSAQAVSAPEVQ